MSLAGHTPTKPQEPETLGVRCSTYCGRCTACAHCACCVWTSDQCCRKGSSETCGNQWRPFVACCLFLARLFLFSFPLLLLFSPKKRFSSFGQGTSRPVRGVPLCPIWEVIRAIFLASRVPTKTKRNEYPVKPTKLQDQF